MADSKSFEGGSVVAMISASLSLRQLSFEASRPPLPSCNSSVGSAKFPHWQ